MGGVKCGVNSLLTEISAKTNLHSKFVETGKVEATWNSVRSVLIQERAEFTSFGLAFGRGDPTSYPFSLLLKGLLKPANKAKHITVKAAQIADLCPVRGI